MFLTVKRFIQDSEVSHQDTQEAQNTSSTFSQDQRSSNISTEQTNSFLMAPERRGSKITMQAFNEDNRHCHDQMSTVTDRFMQNNFGVEPTGDSVPLTRLNLNMHTLFAFRVSSLGLTNYFFRLTEFQVHLMIISTMKKTQQSKINNQSLIWTAETRL